MSVTKKDVDYVLELARLEITKEEKDGMVNDLNKVLLYMEKLNELNTENTEIVVNPYFIENKFREDEIEDSLELKTVLSNAPSSIEEYVKVPKVID